MGRIIEGLRSLASAVTAGGGAARAARSDLRREKSLVDLPEEQPSNAETAVLSRVVVTAYRRDAGEANDLQAGARQLVAAEAEAVRAQAVRDAVVAGEQAARRRQRADEAGEREARTLSQEIDHARPLIGLRVLAGIEVMLLLAEIFFWYQVFTYDTDDGLSWLSVEKLGAVVLGLAIPMLGLLAARAAGATWQRFLRHPAADAAGRRNQHGAVIAATTILVLACYVVFALVYWRYAPKDGYEATSSAMDLPPWPAGLFFAGLILADAVARAFCTSEAAMAARDRDKKVAADRAEVRVVSDRAVSATAGWHTSWLSLRNQVAVALDGIGQVVATGDLLVLQSRSRRADRPAGTGWAQTGSTWTDAGSYAVPTVQLPVHLSIGQVSATLQALTAAVDTLTRHQPPALAEQPALREELDDLHRRIGGLQEAVDRSEQAEADMVTEEAVAEASAAGEPETHVVQGNHVVVPLTRTGSPG
ncbi:hypothetical protein E4P40_25010 [Blastococcus sp. CT_GayMR20]|uniref:hypothetical protein n=1 Tax=Blastococcus sp. CT_GayMR20 TaxID=2559609 RepID=UPI0010731015|nr:hypothetical protein [Blastococcus sp. CT_GayMR20]TFV66836.1 hypothetical protein E4P40_25010 [Blastococcus sp. CT_GayMR20]